MKRVRNKDGMAPVLVVFFILGILANSPLLYTNIDFSTLKKIVHPKKRNMEEVINAANIIVAEIEISYKPLVKTSDCPRITKSKDAYKLFLETWDKGKIEFVEQFKVMLLNASNRVLGICTLTTGSSMATVVDPRMVFAVALKANAAKIITAHNHPSGNVKPSKADHAITYKLKTGGDYLDLSVVDHMIISPDDFYSFAVA